MKLEKGFTLKNLLIFIIVVGILGIIVGLVPIFFYLLFGIIVGLVPIFFYLLFGWLFFLKKVLAYVTFNPLLIIEGIVTVAILIVGVHLFCAWFYSNYDGQKKSRWLWKWSISVVSFLLLTFFISISFTGLIHEIGWLRKTPIFTDRASQATKNILNKIGEDVNSYQKANNHLPVALEPIDIKELKLPKNYDNKSLIDEWGMPIFYSSDGKSFVLKSYGSNLFLGGGDDVIYFSDLKGENDRLNEKIINR